MLSDIAIRTDMHFGTCVIAIVIAIVQTALTTPQFYCKNGEIQQISNFTDGIIKTRETEDGFHGDNLKCSWQIVAPSNWRVKVTVTQLDLDWSSSYSTCDAYDRVNIWEGSNQDGEKLTAICVAWNPGTILSVGNSVFLQFSSTPRNAYQRRGVEMFFEIYDPSNCPPGWIPVPSSSSECLMVERNLTADWSRSQDICKFNKANLASLHSIDEMDALFLTGTGKGIFPAWIGLNDKDGNGQFTWIDRSDLSFQRSIVNQSYKNLCVAQGFDATDWLARECREKLPYICRGNKDGSSILYNEGNEPPPQEESRGILWFHVVIAIVVVLLVLALSIIGTYCYHRKYGKLPWDRIKNRRNKKPEESGNGAGFSPVHQESPRVQPRPSAPTMEAAPSNTGDIMLVIQDPQMVAPPTYEDSQFDRIAPANY